MTTLHPVLNLLPVAFLIILQAVWVFDRLKASRLTPKKVKTTHRHRSS